MTTGNVAIAWSPAVIDGCSGGHRPPLQQFTEFWNLPLPSTDYDLVKTTHVDVPDAGDGLQEMSRCPEARMVITVNVCANLGVTSVSQVTVRVVPRLRVYAESSEFRQRIQVINVSFARFHDPVSFQF